MKHFIIFSILFCLFSSSSIAQKYRVDASKKKVKEVVYPPNVLKINLTSMMLKTFAVQYERKIANNFTMALGVIYRPKSGMKIFDVIADGAGNSGLSQETAFMYRSMKYSRISITPEFRYYFKKKAPKGLYLAPFLKYYQDAMNFNFNYYPDNSTVQKTGLATIKENSFGIGILFGYQIINKKNLAIDLWFAGPWIGIRNAKISSDVKTNNVNEFERAIISSNIEPLFYNRTIEWDTNSINSKMSNYGFGFRMLGVNVGYSF